ncbi:MAG: STAS domain-containing protein [Deltaproteobacteria bacterium]|jgi:anti-anti-sigma factor
MEITHRLENDILTFTIAGRLDAVTAPIAEETIKKTLAQNTKRLLFDLSALEYLSSGGLRVILGAAKEMRRREGKVALAGLNQYVYEIFDVSGFTSMIPIKNTVAEGLKDLAY